MTTLKDITNRYELRYRNSTHQELLDDVGELLAMVHYYERVRKAHENIIKSNLEYYTDQENKWLSQLTEAHDRAAASSSHILKQPDDKSIRLCNDCGKNWDRSHLCRGFETGEGPLITGKRFK